MVELNVIEQVTNVCRTTTLRNAWQAGQSIVVHGLVYSLRDGLLHRIGVSVDGSQSWQERYELSLAGLPA